MANPNVGDRPIRGFALPDGTWLRGLADGQNFTYKSGITAHSGGTKAAALQLGAVGGTQLMYQLDTVAVNGDSALLPKAVAGTVCAVRNAGGATLSLYGQGTDTINGAATANNYDLATNVAALFFCAKDGAWSAIKSA